jgi:esterase/lipase superfamily enzyme
VASAAHLVDLVGKVWSEAHALLLDIFVQTMQSSHISTTDGTPPVDHSSPPLDYPGISEPEQEPIPFLSDHLDDRLHNVLYATNRLREYYESSTTKHSFYGYRRTSNLSYGSAVVRIPENHRVGRLELPPYELLTFGVRAVQKNDREHFTLKALGELTKKQFTHLIQKNEHSSAMVFVHGYNTDFGEAILRLAQIVYDTQYTGIPLAFCWPSKGGYLDYDYDRDSAWLSEDGLLTVLKLLHNEAKVSQIYLVAHSLGNQVVVGALENAARMRCFVRPEVPADCNCIAGHALSEVVFAAPDVDTDVFVKCTSEMKLIAKGITLYASGADKALKLSAAKAQGQRAGLISPGGPLILPDMETIDVTAVGDDMFAINHDVYATERSLIDDLGRLVISGIHPPHIRSPQIRKVPEKGENPRYWRYVP